LRGLSQGQEVKEQWQRQGRQREERRGVKSW
jgi:hypothetical protein